MQTHLRTTLRQAVISVSLAGIPAAWAQPIYRCANLYSDRPCPGAVPVDADDSRSPRQKAETDGATRQIAREADHLERERHTLENARQNAASVPRSATIRSSEGARLSNSRSGGRAQAAKPAEKLPAEPFTATVLLKPPPSSASPPSGPARPSPVRP